jgi:hypothetical protein
MLDQVRGTALAFLLERAADVDQQSQFDASGRFAHAACEKPEPRREGIDHDRTVAWERRAQIGGLCLR